MQELLGRITRLDPQASLALRVIACFDELTVGNVNTRGLLAAAASLAGCVAGFGQQRPARTVRVTPRGELAEPLTTPAGSPPAAATAVPAAAGTCVWLERTGPAEANDAIVLERLALAVRLRHDRRPGTPDARRHLAVLVDGTLPDDHRRTAAAALGLSATASHRVVVAPLFAVWTEHPGGPEDVVPTAHGPLHTLVVPAVTTQVQAGPCGVGVATTPDHLDHSFRTAVVALRLCARGATSSVGADAYAGLVSMFAEEPPGAHHPDVELVAAITAHPWGAETLDALVTSGSARQAARTLGIHHSTLQGRLETTTATLGFDPLDGFGRVRVGVAYLAWRLRTSRVLDLPAPTTGH
ncbi:helix-turn-helix domain-containing protein [Modestobacter sp. Leaf380]|uniref:helix-turn-helix domain-containing protein n=1 Tax=Modestobacter sp. Leaf380 TaxID=1736356 RepID=UPI0006F92B04|nr:helix-turn-helix domain-containing protein [Modestobacter sp. Leaf380]KQS71870.1 CdaR family transcriptional regulator [Modestobacter sp. Leaf380]